MRREHKRCLPVETVSRSAWCTRSNKSSISRSQVVSSHPAILALEVNLISIIRINLTNETVSAANAEPIGVYNSAVVTNTRRPAPRTVVLQTTIDAVVTIRPNRYVIELPNGDMVVVIPIVHPVMRNIDPTVVTKNHVPRVIWINPKRVMINVNPTGPTITCKRLALVLAAIQRRTQHIHVVDVRRIDTNLAVIHRPWVESIDSLPRVATVLRQINASILVLVIALLALQVRRLSAQRSSKRSSRLAASSPSSVSTTTSGASWLFCQLNR